MLKSLVGYLSDLTVKRYLGTQKDKLKARDCLQLVENSITFGLLWQFSN